MVHWIHENATGVPYSHTLRLSSGNLLGGESGWLSSLTDGWNTFGQLTKDHYKPHAMVIFSLDSRDGPQNLIYKPNKDMYKLTTF